ncbi:hypothetical protein F5884DRAFT_254152 [Xylogone sp. PMI_703]|nr:hypothetical protein F5884DRAFT_254152 [Xylogone sp. PMI_703]
MTFDFLVVGGGTSGCILASRLASAKPECKILLVEAGNDTTSVVDTLLASNPHGGFALTDLHWGYSTIAQQHLTGNKIVPYMSAKGLGGGSLLNFMVWTVGSANDYDSCAAYVGDDSWKWEAVSKAFEKITKIGISSTKEEPTDVFKGSLHLHFDNERNEQTTTVLEALAALDIPWNSNYNSGNPLGAGKVWLTHDGQIRSNSFSAHLRNIPSNLEIMVNATVETVLIENNMVIGAQLVDGRKIFASETILSCGAFNSPNILLRSGIGPAEELRSLGIESKIDLPGVGRHLGDHPWLTMTALLDQDAFPANTKDETLFCWVKLPTVLESKEFEGLPSHAQERILMARTPTLEFVVMLDKDPDNGAHRLRIAVAVMNPQSTGTVTIQSENITPRIDPQLLSSPYDQRVLIEGVRLGLSFFETPQISRILKKVVHGPNGRREEDIKAFVQENATIMWHANGTVKMGPIHDPEACVDSNLKVIGVEGLRVADNSIWPETPNGHTQAPAYLVGFMAAEKIINA